jgi:hypothetical protein
MILFNILNSNYSLTKVENNLKLENVIMGREQEITNDLRRAGFGKGNMTDI